ncbi:MAG: GntR family transcriptional regulator [Chloroflexi bacterium]|nr:GntR family transcriptional regulator [Chloroflexota bacterium]
MNAEGADNTFIYRQIAEEIRSEILEGRLQPGDRLPSIRELTRRWNCTAGTAQRAYQELRQQGLVASPAGKGTHVSGQIDVPGRRAQATLRHASLVHRAEAFLLEALTAGYDLGEIQQSIDIAMDRWRVLHEDSAPRPDELTIRFSGSHDMAVIWLAGHLQEVIPGVHLQLSFTGSLGGLMALAEGKADLAGCHLWDVETHTYNDPFIRRLFPGKRMAMIRLATRRIGLIVAPGNPLGITRIEDLGQPGVRFVNRQAGSGTRVWLDATLAARGISSEKIEGYALEKATHFEVAREIAEGRADAGLGLESSATAFGLGFTLLVEEPYELVARDEATGRPPLAALIAWLAREASRRSLAVIKGYDFSQAGETRFIP